MLMDVVDIQAEDLGSFRKSRQCTGITTVDF